MPRKATSGTGMSLCLAKDEKLIIESRVRNKKILYHKDKNAFGVRTKVPHGSTRAFNSFIYSCAVGQRSIAWLVPKGRKVCLSPNGSSLIIPNPKDMVQYNYIITKIKESQHK